MTKQLWDPWIGKNYHTLETRFFFVGESHYSIKEDKSFDEHCFNTFCSDRETTIKIIEQVANGSQKWKLYPNTQKLFDTEDSYKFWNDAAFCNLIQIPMKTLKQRPSNQEYIDGLKIFFTMLKDISPLPTHIVFLGSKAAKFFNRKERDLYIGNELNCEYVGKNYAFNGKITVNYKEIEIFFIKHPSSYFSYKNWNTYLKNKIDFNTFISK